MAILYFNLKALFTNIGEHVSFVFAFLGIILAIILVAYVCEKLIQAKEGAFGKILTTRKMAVIGMFSALAAILMLFEIPLPFAPSFYKLDFSELPILIGTFAFGPMAGVIMEFIKIVLKLFIKGTSTAFVGELANFCVGCSFVLPAGLFYAFRKSKSSALMGCIIGTIVLTVFGTAFNALYLLPAFSKLYGMPLDVILGMGTKVNPLVKEGSIVSFVVCCVAPLNLIKGAANSVITMFVYKPLSRIIKSGINK